MKKKILQIIDAQGWAIDRLASAIVRHNSQFEWRQIYINPKGVERDEYDLDQIKADIGWADVVDVQYWRTLSTLVERIPELKEKKIILTHHNEKNLLSEDWSYVSLHVAKTKYSEKILLDAGYKNVALIYNSYDPRWFKWIENLSSQSLAVGYAGRIVSWKRLKELAKVCYEIGVKILFMGKEDDRDYLNSIPEEHRNNIDWSFMGCTELEVLEFYKNLSCFVNNSASGREVGPLPLIEAMASGVPCISTRTGIAADIGKDRENMVLVEIDDGESLKQAIKDVLNSPLLANKIRENGWRTIKNFTDATMARQYGEQIYKLFSDDPLVSIIIPATYDRADQIVKILEGFEKQDYSNIEVLVCWDEEYMKRPQIRSQWAFPCKEVYTFKSGYNLAMARNLGVIEAHGVYILLCDSRFSPDIESIRLFVNRFKEYRDTDKVWFFGNKTTKGMPADKLNFVENFSMIRRQDLINAGMFNERITEYGGMSQELRSRFLAQGFELVFCPEIFAEELCKSKSQAEKRKNSIVRMKELLRKLNFDK